MQNLALAESLADRDTSQQLSLEALAAEGGGAAGRELDCHLSERTNTEEILDPEVMQQSFPAVNSKGGSSEGFSESSYSSSEPSSSWGDFEGFRESIDPSERFSHNPEVLVMSTKTSRVDADVSSGRGGTSAGHFCSEPMLPRGISKASSSLNELRHNIAAPGLQSLCRVLKSINCFDLENCSNFYFEGIKGQGCWTRWHDNIPLGEDAKHSYEDIFKLGFPEVFVSQSKESIRSLDQVLDTNNEDVWIPELMKNQLCIDSGNIWRTLRDFDNTPSLRYPWSKSHCQENLLSVLGIDANQKDFSESQDDIFEESNVKNNEDCRLDGFSVNDCKALIQTKLSVSLDSRHGPLFTHNLFLKTTSPNESVQYITSPRKKHIFATHNLKMKFFGSDIC